MKRQKDNRETKWRLVGTVTGFRLILRDHEWLVLGRGDSEGWEEMHLVLEKGQTALQVGLGVWQI